MRILYVVHQFYPDSSAGTERFLLSLANAVQRSGHYAEVVTYSMKDSSELRPTGTVLLRYYVYKHIPVTAVRHPRLCVDVNTAVEDPAVRSFARQHLANGRYDIVHIVHPMRMSSFATVAHEQGVPYVMTLTDFWTICPKITLQTTCGSLCSGPQSGDACAQFCPELNSASVKSRLAAIHAIVRRASMVISPSEIASALVQNEFPDIPITVVPHGLCLRVFSAQRKQYEPDRHITFGYCGGLAPHKGVHLLIEAFRSLNTNTAHLHIYGAAAPNERNYAHRLHKLAGGDERIVFCGDYSIEDVGRVFQSIDVLVIPSVWYETYSFTLHEAFASQVPIIASDIGVLGEKIKEGLNGLKFPVGDAAALAGKLKLIIETPTLLNSMRAVLKGFSCPLEEEEAYLYERIYRTAVGAGRSARRVSVQREC